VLGTSGLVADVVGERSTGCGMWNLGLLVFCGATRPPHEPVRRTRDKMRNAKRHDNEKIMTLTRWQFTLPAYLEPYYHWNISPQEVSQSLSDSETYKL